MPISNLVTRVSHLLKGNPADALKLDVEFYRDRYGDLEGLSDDELVNHWREWGYAEGRFPTLESAQMAGDPFVAQDTEVTEVESVEAELAGAGEDNEVVYLKGKPFNAAFYRILNTDLAVAGVDSSESAEEHYNQHGRSEGRIGSLYAYCRSVGLPDDIFPDGFNLSKALADNPETNAVIALQQVCELLDGSFFFPVRFFSDNLLNSKFYLRLSQFWQKRALNAISAAGEKATTSFLEKNTLAIQEKRHQIARDWLAAKSFSDISIVFLKDASTFFQRAELAYKEDSYADSLFYLEEISSSDLRKKPFINRYCELLFLTGNTNKALSFLSEAIAEAPEATDLGDRLDELWHKTIAAHRRDASLASSRERRDRLIKDLHEQAKIVYEAYKSLAGRKEAPERIGTLDCSSVLIIGDESISQCKRYRLEQKKRQLEHAGIKVTLVNWLSLEDQTHNIVSHDIVIFYRVPPSPSILRAMAQVNASERLSIYEIDDLVFHPDYPPDIGSYGGYVQIEQYTNLVHGMALFNVAARFCRAGIASTRPLKSHLSDLVFGSEVVIHRNGLDAFSDIPDHPEKASDVIDIFYGSGTQAHNEDFVSLVLPALDRVLGEKSQARLVVVGYLKLPIWFLNKHHGQVKQIPAIKSMEAYWSLLSAADINLAVLRNDTVNACKSELKWFEAASFGIPSIVSDTENYLDVIDDGVDGIIARDESEWYQSLLLLIDSKQNRNEIGGKARNRVNSEYSPEVLGASLKKKLEGLAGSTGSTNAPKRKKVAIVNVFYPPQSIGGATRVVADNVRCLVDKYNDEFEVVVFTADAEYRPAHRLDIAYDRGVKVYRATTLWRRNMDWFAIDPGMDALFEAFLGKESPDLVHFHCIQRLTGTVIETAKRKHIPFVITVHDAWWISDYQFLVDLQGNMYPNGHPDTFDLPAPPPDISVTDAVERRTYLSGRLNSANKVLTVSEAFSRVYQANGIAPIEVVANGIDTAYFNKPKSTANNDNVIIGLVGGMSAHKGFEVLKSAVQSVQPENIEVLLVDHSKPFGFSATEFWGKVKLTIVGRYPQSQTLGLYQRLDVLIAMSIWPESFGLVTREAAAVGCWVVASSMGGIGEDVTDDGGFVAEPKQENLEAILTEIDSNPGRYKGLASHPAPIDVSSSVDKLVGVYKEILGD